MLVMSMAAAIDDKEDELQEALKGQEELIHCMSKMAQWTDTPTKSMNFLDCLKHFMVLTTGSSLFKQLREQEEAKSWAPPSDEHCMALAKMKDVFLALRSLDVNDFIMSTLTETFGAGSAKDIKEWAKLFQSAVESQVESIKLNSLAALSSQAERAQEATQDFNEGSERPKAEAVKKEADKLAVQRASAAKIMGFFTIPAEETPELAKAEEVQEQAKDRSLVWGFSVLLARKMVMDPVRGKADRQRIRSLYQENIIKSTRTEIISEAMQQQITEVLAVDATSEGNVLPLKKGQKRKAA